MDLAIDTIETVVLVGILPSVVNSHFFLFPCITFPISMACIPVPEAYTPCPFPFPRDSNGKTGMPNFDSRCIADLWSQRRVESPRRPHSLLGAHHVAALVLTNCYILAIKRRQRGRPRRIYQ